MKLRSCLAVATLTLAACEADTSKYKDIDEIKIPVLELPDYSDLPQVPKIHITGIRLFFEKEEFSNFSIGVDENNLPKDLILKFDKNHLTFDFVGIYHTSPDKIRYKFKLEGFDDGWQPITVANFVTYSNI